VAVTSKDVYELIDRETSSIKEDLKRIENRIENGYVTRNEIDAKLKPMQDDINRFKNLVYGTIATLIALIIAALLGGQII